MSRIRPSRPLPEKMNRVRDPSAAKRWLKTRTICYLCGASFPLQTHHIVQASGKSDEPCNFAALCAKCHHAYHHEGGDKRDKMRLVLDRKFLLDPSEWDPERLAVLYGRPLP